MSEPPTGAYFCLRLGRFMLVGFRPYIWRLHASRNGSIKWHEWDPLWHNKKL